MNRIAFTQAKIDDTGAAHTAAAFTTGHTKMRPATKPSCAAHPAG
jgi:hypothetical protein